MKSSLGAVSILACILFGCATADPLEPRDFSVGAVREGMSEAKVREALGAPQEMKPGEVWAYPGLEVRFSSAGTVTGIMLTGAQVKTARGLYPGEMAQQALMAHGMPYRVNGVQWIAAPHHMPSVTEGTTWTYCLPKDPVCERVLNIEVGPKSRIRTIFVGRTAK
jgi:hypothetical protein